MDDKARDIPQFPAAIDGVCGPEMDLFSNSAGETLERMLQEKAAELRPTFTPEEARFLDDWAGILGSGLWNPFLATWLGALKSYGTGIEFMDGAKLTETSFEVSGRTFSGIILTGGKFLTRARLTREQEPYQPRLRSDGYEFRNRSDCPLCQNVCFGRDVSLGLADGSNNILFDFGRHVLAPNRYPAQAGASLLIPKDHDDTTARAAYDIYAPGKVRIPVEAGKTRGKLAEPEDLRMLFAVCDLFGFGGTKNHVLNVMSIPEHEHFHVTPAGSPLFKALKEINFDPDKNLPEPALFFPESLPFASLALKSKEREKLIERVIPILRRLELNNEVFTYAYLDGLFVINVANKEAVGDGIHGPGGGVFAGINVLDPEDLEAFSNNLRLHHLRGAFDWSPYIG